VLLTVADDGPGIPAPIQEHIFEPFFTTKDPEGGSGLGLSIVQSLVVRNGGSVRVRSTPGAGAAFDILLPARTASVPAGPEAARGTIVAVDDEEPVLLLLQRILLREGYQVLVARDGREAQAALERAGQADLLVADIILAQETGLEVARALRQHQSALPVLFISGHLGPGPDREVAREIEDLEARFLAKPFTQRTLLAAVQQALAPTVRDPGRGAGR